MSWPLRGIAARIALVSLVVTLAAAAVIAIGVLAVSSALFAQLMVQHGSTTAAAHAMFDQTVTAVFGGALLVAAVVSGVLAVVLARRLAQPLEAVGRAAQRLACGDYQARRGRALRSSSCWLIHSIGWRPAWRRENGSGGTSLPTPLMSCERL